MTNFKFKLSFLKAVVVLIFLPSILISQDKRSIFVKYTDEDVVIDGISDEKIWQNEENMTSDYWLYFPVDTTTATKKTVLRLAFDDEKIYAFIKLDHDGKDYVVPSLKRDFRASGNDNVSLIMDPFCDGINAFIFGVNPYGVQREGLISLGGTERGSFSTSWDQKWESITKINDDHWTVEMAIPFSSIRFIPNSTRWRLNSYRFDMKANERSSWVNIPRNQLIMNLGYLGDMIFEKPITNKGSKYSFIPFVAGGASKKYNTPTPSKVNLTSGVGGDIKVAVTSSMNLDMTINPDFSQVEVDQQVVNIDRFEIFFPERRQFFLENEDLFASYGFENINPFFSRRIGIGTDPVTKLSVQNPIYAGMRLNGKLNDKWRLGLLSMQTADIEDFGVPSFNHSMLSIQRKVGARSNFAGFFANKFNLDKESNLGNGEFNRLFGLDYNFATSDNRWTGKVFYHRSLSPQQKDLAFSHGATIGFVNQNAQISWRHEMVGAGYDAQMGFVRRRDYQRYRPQAAYSFFPKNSKINSHGPEGSYELINQGNLGFTDKALRIGYGLGFLDNSRFELMYANQYVYLFSPFDPTGTNRKRLVEGTSFQYNAIEAMYFSDNSKKFNYTLRSGGGEYFNGQRYFINSRATYRFEPKVSLSLGVNYNYFTQDHLEKSVDTWLLSPTVDITFSKSLFLTTFVQYNSQIKNTNVNTRLQWRFAPVSDFFLVFTSNSFMGDTGPESRFLIQRRDQGIVAKWTYWLNV